MLKFLGFTITRGEQAARPDDGLTPTQRLAKIQAESVAGDFLTGLKRAKSIGWVVLLAVMAVSFEDQYHYLVHKGFRAFAAVLIAGVFDLATVFCVTVIGVAAMKLLPRLLALGVVLLPVTASGYINVQAATSREAAIIYIAVVAMIPAIEVIKAFLGANLQYMRRIELSLLGMAEQITATPGPKKARRVVTEAERKARLRDDYEGMNDYRREKWRNAWDAEQDRAAARKARTPKAPAVASSPVSPGEVPLAELNVGMAG